MCCPGNANKHVWKKGIHHGGYNTMFVFLPSNPRTPVLKINNAFKHLGETSTNSTWSIFSEQLNFWPLIFAVKKNFCTPCCTMDGSGCSPTLHRIKQAPASSRSNESEMLENRSLDLYYLTPSILFRSRCGHYIDSASRLIWLDTVRNTQSIVVIISIPLGNGQMPVKAKNIKLGKIQKNPRFSGKFIYFKTGDINIIINTQSLQTYLSLMQFIFQMLLQDLLIWKGRQKILFNFELVFLVSIYWSILWMICTFD